MLDISVSGTMTPAPEIVLYGPMWKAAGILPCAPLLGPGRLVYLYV